MKSCALLFLLVNMAAPLHAQETFKNDTVIKGRVYMKRNNKEYGVAANFSIIGTDGSSIEVLTDSTGNYYLSNKQASPRTSYVISPSYVPGLSQHYFCMRTGKFTTVGKSEADLPLIHDYFVEDCRCWFVSFDIFFPQNSSRIDSSLADQIGEIANSIKLREDGSTVVKVCGRAGSNEKDPAKLANLRANAVVNELIKQGVRKEQLIALNYADTVYYVVNWEDRFFEYKDVITPEFISNLKDPKLIEEAEKMSRMVYLKFIREDHAPIK